MKTTKKMSMGGTTMMSDSTMMKKGGAVAKMKKTKMAKSDSLKDVPTSKKGLAKLPTEVRNKMGYKKMGGSVKGKKC